MLILHETNSRVPSNGQRTQDSCSPGHSYLLSPMAASFTRLGFYSVPQKSATERPRLDGRRYSILHSTRVRLARQNVYWTLASVLKGNEKENVAPGPSFGSARNPPGDDDLKPERLPEGTKADDDRCDAVR